jgi:formylglycine-generating enzyme required for sulfatase activity
VVRNWFDALAYCNWLIARAQRETLHVREDDPRVRRGGAFWNAHQNVRCAYRNRNNARNLNDNYGMRVVLVACIYFGTRNAQRGAV